MAAEAGIRAHAAQNGYIFTSCLYSIPQDAAIITTEAMTIPARMPLSVNPRTISKTAAHNFPNAVSCTRL